MRTIYIAQDKLQPGDGVVVELIINTFNKREGSSRVVQQLSASQELGSVV
jgi:hypothetical protein